MSVKCRTFIDKIEQKYPKSLSEEWDNVGLLIGDFELEISKILVCLELNEKVVDEAVENHTDMIVSHHPLIFNPINRIVSSDYISRQIIKLIKNDINLYAMHTNFDAAADGMNDILASKLDLTNIKPLCTSKANNIYKIAVYVPYDYSDKVRCAMFDAGAGCTGNYNQSSFNVNGISTFLPLQGARPFIGAVGQVEHVNEVKIETIVKENDLQNVISSMLTSHPYEEAAFDVIKLENPMLGGIGRYGFIKNSITFMEFCNYVKQKLNIPELNVTGNLSKKISKVAVIGGSGMDYIDDAISAGCDVLITGDVKHHSAIDAASRGICVIDGGHYFTEIAAVPYIYDYIKNNFDVECIISKINTSPFTRV